jgi:hypothetical protein
VKYWFAALIFVGCAQPQSGRSTSTSSTGGATTAGTTSTGGMGDMAISPGADLSMDPNNLPDFGGHDLAKPSGDLAAACDPVKQTGCNAGQKCGIGNNGPECASNGTVATAMQCGTGTSDDCVAGNLCLQEDATHLLCRQFCNMDSDCKQPAAAGNSNNVGRCIITITGISYMACTTPCDPVLPTAGCPTGLSCIHAHTMSMVELTNCEIVGMKTDTQACSTINDCAPGYTCVAINGMPASCRKVCAKADNTECTGIGAGYTCHKNGSDFWGACF